MSENPQLRVQVLLAEYNALTDEIRSRNTYQVTIAIIAVVLLTVIYVTAFAIEFQTQPSSLPLWYGYSSIVLITGSVICSLAGIYVCSQAHTVAQFQKYIDEHIRSNMVRDLGPGLLQWNRTLGEMQSNMPWLGKLAFHTPLPTILLLGAVNHLLYFFLSYVSRDDLFFHVQFEAISGHVPAHWPYFALALICLGWFLFTFNRLLSAFRAKRLPKSDKTS